jgi:hypothetical protein
MPPRRARRGLRRAAALLLLGAASGAATALVLEVAVRLGGLFPGPRALVRQAGSAGDATAEDRFAVPHPFRGWSRVPGGGRVRRGARPSGLFLEDATEAGWDESAATNVHGFFSHLPDYREVGADRFAVAILGGSVAGELATVGRDALAGSITREVPRLKGRVEVLNVAAGGYKQPQQVTALAELLVLGVPIDAVVNLDGFNEAALGTVDVQAGFHPFFPSRRHHAPVLDLARAGPSGPSLELAAEVAGSRRRARELAAAARSPLLRWSELGQAVAGLLVQRAQAEAARLEDLLQRETARAPSAGTATLSAPCLARPDGCAELIGDLWARSSLLLGALARETGAVYVHVLQPSQYAPGAKVLTTEERTRAWAPEDEWPRAARLVYPVLRRRGEELRRQGVDFHDLTALFAGRRDTVFRDPCCHLNRTGYEALAEAIAGRLAAQLRPLRAEGSPR